DALGKALAGAPGVAPHAIDERDRSTYWFHMFRLKPGGLKCDRSQFLKALAAEGVRASAGYIPTPMYGNPVFQQHGFFARRWPGQEVGLTSMDYSQVSCTEAEAILGSGLRMVLHERMTESYGASVGAAIKKVAEHYHT